MPIIPAPRKLRLEASLDYIARPYRKEGRKERRKGEREEGRKGRREGGREGKCTCKEAASHLDIKLPYS
jgi:hypothetical protein